MKTFSIQYFDELLHTAKQSQRLRAHINLHLSYSDPCQKLFNAIQLNSYIRPHRHAINSGDECLLAIRGLFGCIVFTDQGMIESIELFGSEKFSDNPRIASGLEVPSVVWHSVIALVDDSILFEAKNGPFNPTLAKEFAPWAPEESDKNATLYFQELQKECFKRLKML